MSFLLNVLRKTYDGFTGDDIFGMAASLAYYTVFSLAPILLIISAILGLIMDEAVVRQQIFTELGELVGRQTAAQFKETLNQLDFGGSNVWATIIGVTTSIVGSTTVFVSLQTSLNTIWKTPKKPKSGWLKMLKERLLSFGLVLSIGFILLVSMSLNALFNGLDTWLSAKLPIDTLIFLDWANAVVPILIITFLFALIYKVLPDMEIQWSTVWIGAIVTAVLFSLGRWAIGIYLGNSETASLYGAAGSIIVLLSWVYYTAVIFYLGAEFTYAWASIKQDLLPQESKV